MGDELETRPRVSDATLTGTAEVAIAPVDEHGGDQGRFALLIYSGDGTEVVRLLPGAAIVIGRDFPAHVQIDDPKVSRQHARFVLHDGSVHVEDLGSRNGTKVNGARIQSATLDAGDEVQLGAVRVSLAVSRPAQAQVSDDESVVLRDPRVVELYQVATRAARTDVPVLVLGETGTGKEHVARTIHSASTRANGPWRAINCSALPANLVESTLFGHERGAFTGADRRSKGVFEEADGGTLFLDEVAELSLPAQAALLRVLETKTFQRVGSQQEQTCDVRIVAATHCNLEAAVEEGSFRRDLLYRINTVTLELPPLRERASELEVLVTTFLRECQRQWDVPAQQFAPDALARLHAYEWPGNIRQLRNAVERAALVAPHASVRLVDLPPYLRDLDEARPAAANSRTSTLPPPPPTPEPPPARAAAPLIADVGLKLALRDYEAQIIQRALARTGGNRMAAAKLLRVPRRTLYRRMQALGLLTEASAELEEIELDS